MTPPYQFALDPEFQPWLSRLLIEKGGHIGVADFAQFGWEAHERHTLAAIEEERPMPWPDGDTVRAVGAGPVRPWDWFPHASTWVSVDGDEPRMVVDVHFNNGVVKLSDGEWAAISKCESVPEPSKLYIPKPGERVRVVEVAEEDPNPAHTVGEVVTVKDAFIGSTKEPGFLILSSTDNRATWCRVAPVVEPPGVPDGFPIEEPEGDSFRNRAPVVEPVGERPHADGSVLHKLWGMAHDAPGYDKSEWLKLQKEMRSTDASKLRSELSAALAKTETLRKANAELIDSRCEARAFLERELEATALKVRELEAKNAELIESNKGCVAKALDAATSLATVERERDELKTELEKATAHSLTLTELYGPVIRSLQAQLSASNAELERVKGELAKTKCRCAGQRFNIFGHCEDCGKPRNDQSPAAPPLREIRVGQTWEYEHCSSCEIVSVEETIGVQWGTKSGDREVFTREEFFAHFTFVSDPPAPATVATKEEGQR